MTNFDQRHQTVENQINVGGNVNLNDPSAVNARKAEISREISALTPQINQLEVKVNALQAQVKLGMIAYLPQDVARNLLFNPKMLEDESLMVRVSIAASSQDAFQQMEEIRSLREDYQQKNAELQSLKQHLETLQGEMRRLGEKDMVGTIVSAIKSFIN